MRSLAVFLICAAAAWGQVAAEANAHYQGQQQRQRMIRTLSAPNRAKRLQAQKIVDALSLKGGETVVDLGTGAGMLLPFLSEAVGPTGKVIAEDIHQDFIDTARQTAEGEKLGNVEYVVGTTKSPNLAGNSADVIVTVDSYHHFDYPGEMLAGVREGLKANGRFVVVDYYKHGFTDPNHIRLDKADAVKEIESHGFELVEDREHIAGSQYIVFFRKN